MIAASQQAKQRQLAIVAGTQRRHQAQGRRLEPDVEALLEAESFAIRPGQATGRLGRDHVAWTFDNRIPDASTPLVYQGRLYVLDDDRKVLTCLDPATGKRRYKSKVCTSQKEARDWLHRHGIATSRQFTDAELEKAKQAIDEASKAGAKLFAPGVIARAIRSHTVPSGRPG